MENVLFRYPELAKASPEKLVKLLDRPVQVGVRERARLTPYNPKYLVKLVHYLHIPDSFCKAQVIDFRRGMPLKHSALPSWRC